MLVLTWMQAVLGVVVAILTISGVLLAWTSRGRHERKAKRAFEQVFRSDWMGEDSRPGVPERPGVMTQLFELTQGWEAVRERLRRAELEIKNLRSQHTILFNRITQVESDCPLSHLEHTPINDDSSPLELAMLSHYEGDKP